MIHAKVLKSIVITGPDALCLNGKKIHYVFSDGGWNGRRTFGDCTDYLPENAFKKSVASVWYY